MQPAATVRSQHPCPIPMHSLADTWLCRTCGTAWRATGRRGTLDTRWHHEPALTDPVIARAYTREREAAALPWWQLLTRHRLRRAAADDRAYAQARGTL